MPDYKEGDRIVRVLRNKKHVHVCVLEFKGDRFYLFHTVGNYGSMAEGRIAAKEFVTDRVVVGDKHIYQLEER